MGNLLTPWKITVRDMVQTGIRDVHFHGSFKTSTVRKQWNQFFICIYIYIYGYCYVPPPSPFLGIVIFNPSETTFTSIVFCVLINSGMRLQESQGPLIIRDSHPNLFLHPCKNIGVLRRECSVMTLRVILHIELHTFPQPDGKQKKDIRMPFTLEHGMITLSSRHARLLLRWWFPTVDLTGPALGHWPHRPHRPHQTWARPHWSRHMSRHFTSLTWAWKTQWRGIRVSDSSSREDPPNATEVDHSWDPI